MVDRVSPPPGREVNGLSQPLRECTQMRNDSHKAWPCSSLLESIERVLPEDVHFAMEIRVSGLL
jgi:hypothetical protein